jgi:hypothetical protein
MTTAMNYSDSSETYEKTGSSKDITDPAPGDFREPALNLPALGFGQMIGQGLQVPRSLFAGPSGDAIITERSYLKTPFIRKIKKPDIFGDDTPM